MDVLSTSVKDAYILVLPIAKHQPSQLHPMSAQIN